MSYQNRRYLVVDGKLQKSWANPPPAGWFVKKSDAWAAEKKINAEAKVRDDELAAEAKVRDDELAAEEAAAKKIKADERATAEASRLAEEAAAATKLAEEAAARLTNGGEPATAPSPAVETPDPTTPEPVAEAAAVSEPEPEAEPAPPAMLRMRVVMEMTGLSRAAIQRGLAASTFPAAHDLGKGELCWPEPAIEAWLQDRPEASDAAELGAA